MITPGEIAQLITKTDIAIDPKTLVDNLSLEDQGIDSMDISTLLVAVEKSYSVKIPPEEADQLQTLQAIADYVNTAHTFHEIV